MSQIILKYGEWQPVCLCSTCGVIVSREEKYGSPPCCKSCGATSKHVLRVVQTTRRFCYTFIPKKWKFWQSPKGYWEWSGKCVNGANIDSMYLTQHNRILSNHTTVVAAAGIASGLF